MLYSRTGRAARMPLHARVASAVMSGESVEGLCGEPSATEMKLARKQSVGLEFVSHYPAARAPLEEETGRQVAFRRAMHETSVLLASCGIPHIYIKFRKLYRYYDSNVDVIVAHEHWQPAIAALEAEGYAGHVMFKEPDKIMFSRQGAAVSAHLHPGVTWNGVPYFDLGELWSHSSPAAGESWLELSDEYDYLINLAHNVFENYEISLGDMLYFRNFLREHSLDTSRLEAVAAANGWRLGFRQLQAQVVALVEAWERTLQTGQVPPSLLAYPYRISMPALARAFGERIASNVAARRLRLALREAYAYPAFYVLKRRHDLPFLAR
jgi:hypothetical protein